MITLLTVATVSLFVFVYYSFKKAIAKIKNSGAVEKELEIEKAIVELQKKRDQIASQPKPSTSTILNWLRSPKNDK